ncbi:hypothetical protein EAE96_002009 [Botrytis aclada]|nr:hypothetical protein EAE96_002009 [Botrytis aclada]
MPLTVLNISRRKDPNCRGRNLSLEYAAVHASYDTAPYLSVCPAVIYSNKVGGFKADIDLTNAIACIEGPSESPYAGGIFFLHVYFPLLFPERPMKMRFLTPIHHPNISADEDIRLPSLTTEWIPETTLLDTLMEIFSLLGRPELNDNSVPEIAKEFVDDYSGFFEKARLSTSEHASDQQLDVNKLVLDWLEDYVTLDYEIASCHKALSIWRQNIWETLPKDGSREDVELECVLPESVIVTISQNLRRLCTREIGLEELDLSGWEKRDQYITDHSASSLGVTLVVVWLKLQNEKKGIEDEDYILPGAAVNDAVEDCQETLRHWRDTVWERYPEDTFPDRESVLPDSAIVTISNNLEKLGSHRIKLEHLNLWEWDHSVQFLAEDNEFCLRKLLQSVWEENFGSGEETMDTAVSEGSHGSEAEGSRSPRGLQLLGFKTAGSTFSQASSSSRRGLHSNKSRSSKPKQELRVTKSEPGPKAKNSKSKQGFQTTTSDPGPKAGSSKSVQESGITKDDLDSDMQDIKSEVGKLTLPISEDDLRSVAEGSRSSEGLQATGGEETNRRLKGKGKAPATS